MSFPAGIKFRCYPTEDQATILSQWIGCQRLIYNAKVSEDRYFRTFLGKSLSLAGSKAPIDQQYSQFKDKELTPFLYDVPSQILRNAAVRFKGAYSRFFVGLAERPTHKSKHGRQTVWLTSELFRFEATGEITVKKRNNKPDLHIKEHRLLIGTKTNDLGELSFMAHDEYEMPASITIARHAGKWYVSFTYVEKGVEMTEDELVAHFSTMTPEELESVTLGGDRGVAKKLVGSDGIVHDTTDEQKTNLAKKEVKRKRYERRFAKQQQGSNRQKKTKNSIARIKKYEADVRDNFAHQSSSQLVKSDSQVFVLEDLRIKSMTKRPEPKQGENGKYLPNGASAKAGLNRSILASSWGKLKTFTAYKGRRKGKLLITVSAHRSSQECSSCGHTHPKNRKSQSEFVCRKCGFTTNADHNAALVIKKRGIAKLLAGEIVVKQKKRTMRLKKDSQLAAIGPEQSELTHGEMDVSRSVDRNCVHRSRPSKNRETPTTTASSAV
jgi:putative transposase